MHKLKIITSTTRPNSQGIRIANWVTDVAIADTQFETELLDLSKIALPFMDEPNHPRLRQYTHEHTKQWSRTIEEADAFIIVLGEYNFGIPAPIKNALDFLFQEWAHKPVAFVAYGGISGGLRSLQMIKQVVTTLSMMPLTEGVSIPFFAKRIEEGVFKPEEGHTKSAHAMLRELNRWATALKTMRTKA